MSPSRQRLRIESLCRHWKMPRRAHCRGSQEERGSVHQSKGPKVLVSHHGPPKPPSAHLGRWRHRKRYFCLLPRTTAQVASTRMRSTTLAVQGMCQIRAWLTCRSPGYSSLSLGPTGLRGPRRHPDRSNSPPTAALPFGCCSALPFHARNQKLRPHSLRPPTAQTQPTHQPGAVDGVSAGRLLSRCSRG